MRCMWRLWLSTRCNFHRGDLYKISRHCLNQSEIKAPPHDFSRALCWLPVFHFWLVHLLWLTRVSTLVLLRLDYHPLFERCASSPPKSNVRFFSRGSKTRLDKTAEIKPRVYGGLSIGRTLMGHVRSDLQPALCNTCCKCGMTEWRKLICHLLIPHLTSPKWH